MSVIVALNVKKRKNMLCLFVYIRCLLCFHFLFFNHIGKKQRKKIEIRVRFQEVRDAKMFENFWCEKIEKNLKHLPSLFHISFNVQNWNPPNNLDWRSSSAVGR